MAQKKSGIGRGLDALFLETFEEEKKPGGAEKLKASLIDPKRGQPRRSFDSESLSELAESIATHGVLQPILVRATGAGRYQIIAGERRWRAAKQAGLTEIPAVILDRDDLAAAEIALVENVQREDLNPIEEAAAFRALSEEFGLTQEDLSRRVGKSRSYIANATRLLELPDEVKNLVAAGALSAGHARTLLGLRDRSQILPFAKKCEAEGLSVRETEQLVKRANRPVRETPDETPTFKVDYVAELERKMTSDLGRRVKIAAKGKQKTLTLFFEDNEDLDALLRRIMGDDFVGGL